MQRNTKLQPRTGWQRLNLALWYAHREQRLDEEVRKKGFRIGIYLDLVTWNTIRLVTSVMTGLVGSIIIAGLFAWGAGWYNGWLHLALAVGLVYWTFQPAKEKRLIPPGQMAQVTLFGVPLRVYFLAGEFTWTLAPIVSVNRKILKGTTGKQKEIPGISPEGFAYSGDFPLQVWNQYSPGVNTGRTGDIVGNAYGGEQVSITLQHILRHLDLATFNRSPDPIAKVADRARQAARAAMGFLTPLDLVKMKDVLANLLVGKRVLVCRVTKTTRHYVEGSVVRDVSGQPMFEICDTTDEAKRAVPSFINRLNQEGREDMLEVAARQKATQHLQVVILELKSSLVDIIHDYGLWLESSSVGRVTIPKEIEEAAAAAASQPLEAQTQTANARAAKAARKELMPTEEEVKQPHFLDLAVMAAALDPSNKSIRPIAVIGGGQSGLNKAAAVLGEALNKRGDE